MRPALLGYVLLAVGACDKTLNTLPTAFTLRGQIQFNDLGAPFPAGSFGGDIQLLAYAESDEGYCLQTSELRLVGFNVVSAPDEATLEGDGVAFEVSVLEAPGTTYPFSIYPMALWQDTSSFNHACEIAADNTAHFNAVGFYGLALDDYQRGPTSPCCGFSPQPVVIAKRGAVVEGVDFFLIPQAFDPSQCVAPDAPTDICGLRHPPGSTVGDSACFTALGSQAAGIFVQVDSDGKVGACP